MRQLTLGCVTLSLFLLGACASSSSSGEEIERDSTGKPLPSRLKHSTDDVPDAVKEIEVFIERPGAADGGRHRDRRLGQLRLGRLPHRRRREAPAGGSEARWTHLGGRRPGARPLPESLTSGPTSASSSTSRGMGVVPYIKIKAHGQALYVHTPEGKTQPVIRRARAITIANDRIGFLGPENRVPAPRPAVLRAGAERR